LLDGPGADGRRTKLLDWGMARIAGEVDPLHGMIAGTLTYVAPEQARGDDITPAADVYSLAVMAYQLLLGEPPFASPNDIELLHKHLRTEPPRPRTLWAAIPDELDTLLVAMLAKQPADRPALAEVTRALRATRRSLRASRPSKLRWFDVPLPIDVIGRPTLPLLANPRHRLLGAALGLALTVTSVLQLFIA
jgi:serine/threonine-protein kinase